MRLVIAFPPIDAGLAGGIAGDQIRLLVLSERGSASAVSNGGGPGIVTAPTIIEGGVRIVEAAGNTRGFHPAASGSTPRAATSPDRIRIRRFE